MEPIRNIEELIRKKLHVTAGPTLHDRVLARIRHAQEQYDETIPALTQPVARRTIMKSPILKLAVAAVVIVAVVLGLFELLGTESQSGVVWAEVAKKVEASRGVIYRSREVASDSRDDAPDYTMNYLSSTHSRLDSYKGDQIIKTIYDDYNTKTVILVDYFHKSYVKMTFDEKIQQSNFLTDPNRMVQRFLSCKHRKLEPKTVEGVLCEGIETTDPAFDEYDYTDSVMARVWVSVETGYPVRLEVELVRNNGEIRIGGVSDQFQWDVELDESIFEPNIPPDYIDISP